eukprot:1148694-Rhodomonas_salina.1
MPLSPAKTAMQSRPSHSTASGLTPSALLFLLVCALSPTQTPSLDQTIAGICRRACCAIACPDIAGGATRHADMERLCPSHSS